jgi:carbamate kinase
MRLVVALGGNALLERGEAPDSEIQERHVQRAVEALIPLVEQHEVTVTHGNGPQVGVLAIESANDPSLAHPYPFDALGAQTQGLIGYWLIQALQSALPDREVACVLSRTIVDSADPAFSNPSKFVGPVYTKSRSDQLAADFGWDVRADGQYWRRVVPSPEPRTIVELNMIRLLIDGGAVVVCMGGGGIPVVREPGGQLRGVEAVIDKDLGAALLAEKLGADGLLLLTDVSAVELDYGTANARPIGHTTVEELRSASFPAGSMGPKVTAACRFVGHAGGLAAIGSLGDAALLLSGNVGTLIRPTPGAAASHGDTRIGT